MRKESQEPTTTIDLEVRHESGTSELPETEAVQLARRGDARGFERVYLLHCRKVYGLFRRMARNPAEAEDLTQETFLQVFRKINTFRGDSSFSTWLHRVAVNVLLMKWRRKHWTEVSLEEMSEPDVEGGAPREPAATCDLRLAGVVDRILLERAMDQLPPGCKAVLVLHDIQGRAHREIAKILGCTVGNSKSQVHRARRRLRDILRGRRCLARQKPPRADGSLSPQLI